MRYRKGRSDPRPALETTIISDDVVAHFNALIANEHGWTSDEFPHIILVFVAERATENLRVTLFLTHASCSSISLLSRSELSVALADHLVNDTVFLGLLGRHDVVSLGVFLYPFDRLTGVFYEELVQTFASPDDLPRCDIDVGCLATQARHERLMDYDPRIWQRKTLALSAGCQQHSTHSHSPDGGVSFSS